MIAGKLTPIFTSPLFIKESNKEVEIGGKSIKLRDFQYELLKAFLNRETHDMIILTAPTGAGKTLSLLIPLFANLERSWMYYGSVGIYPSRNLARDQMITISNTLLKLGATQADIKTFYKDLGGLSNSELESVSEYVKAFKLRARAGTTIPVVLMYITSESLNKLRKIVSKHLEIISSNRALLEYLWMRIARNAFRVVFTIPEYPYLLATDVYQDFHRAGVWLYATLRELKGFLKVLESSDIEGVRKWFKALEVKIDRRRLFKEFYTSREFIRNLANIFILFRAPVFFDEFHLYSGFSLASFISLLYVYMLERGIGKIVVSSATPVKTVLIKKRRRDLVKLVEDLAKRMGYTIKVVSAETSTTPRKGFVQIRKRTLINVIPVVLRGRHTTGPSAFGALQRYVPEILKEVDWLRKYKERGRSMILVDRVASVLELGYLLKDLAGEEPLIICSMKSLLPKEWLRLSELRLREAKLIVGNIAIAFGVDIKGMDLGLVIAKDYLTALQKIGRYGRGGGEDYAEILLPIPFSKYRRVKELLKEVRGREIPYISTETGDGPIDFIALLTSLYPMEPPDILIRWRIGIFKTIFPVWVYTLANIVRERSEVREQLHTASRVNDVKFIHHFTELIHEIGRYFKIKDLPRRLRYFIRLNVFLTPIAFYNLYSYRSIAGIPIRAHRDGDIVEETLNLTTAGRNIPLTYKYGSFWIDDSGILYKYTTLWIGIDRARAEYVKSVLKKLNHKVHTLRYFVELLKGDSYLIQGRRRVCEVARLLDNSSFWDIPVAILRVGDPTRKRLIEYLSAVESVIPVYVIEDSNEQGELLGGVFLL